MAAAVAAAAVLAEADTAAASAAVGPVEDFTAVGSTADPITAPEVASDPLWVAGAGGPDRFTAAVAAWAA